MTLYWWTHWFWITVCGVVLIECTPLSSIDTFPSKLSKLEENNNKSTYLKRAGKPTQLPNPNGGGNPPPGSRFISSLPPVAAASSGLLSSSSSSSSSSSQSAPVAPQPTINSLIPDSGQDVDDTFAGGSLAGTDFGPDVVRYTRKEADPVGSTASSVEVTAATTTGAGRLKKNGTIFTRNEQNITTLKLKNYNRGGAGVEKEEMKAAASTVRVPDRGTRLVDTLMQVATVENGTSVEDVEVQPEQVTEVAVDLNVTESALEDSSSSAVDNTTVPAAPTGSIQSIDFNSSSSSSSTSFSNSSSDSDLASSSNSNGRELPDDSHSDSSGGNSRIGKILSSDFRDFVSPGAGGQPNASSYIAQSIAFSTQNLQEGVDDQDHPLEDDDYRRSSRSQSPGRLNVGAISGICLASLGLLSGLSAALVILYRRYLYLNKPQALSEPDSSGYIDDSTIRDNSDEMYSLDNDSFLNSLEAMTIQNYWTDNVKHTKL